MTRRGLALLRQLGGFAVLALLALSLSGDRTSAAGVPATIYGQDPLEVLELKVKPNVLIVLDTSSSMLEAQDNDTGLASGDHPRSKLYQGKQTIRRLVELNQDKVSFWFGTYTTAQHRFYNADPGSNRFQYVTGTMPATQLTVQGALGDTLGRGLQSWQIIYPEWDQLYFGESGGRVCVADLLLTAPAFYAKGDDLALLLTNRMNGASCTGGARQNTYQVRYTPATGVFTFGIVSGPATFQIRWADTPNNIAGALGKRGAANTTLSTSSTPSGTPYTLLYRDGVVLTQAQLDNGGCNPPNPTPAPAGCGNRPNAPFIVGSGANELATQYFFREEVPNNSGNFVPFWQLGAGRYWNGETIRVTSTGAVCGMDFATATTKRYPASIVVELASATCAPMGQSARFDFAGGRVQGAAPTDCKGFRARQDLVPCDLRPPAPTQMQQMRLLMEDEVPVDTTTGSPTIGDPKDWDGDGTVDYQELRDGSWATDLTTLKVSPSIHWRGSTPIANSLIDIKGEENGSDTSCATFDPVTDVPIYGPCPRRNFKKLWFDGQVGSTAMAGPPPWQLDPIRNHRNPKEKTIVLFVTDGNDTCASRPSTPSAGSPATFTNARRAAYYAEELYHRLEADQPASSVTTYMIGYGFSARNLDFIAWGGSGLGDVATGQPDVDWVNDTEATIRAKRAQCTTCVDGFEAPNAEALGATLQALIDRGATEGEFSAQQSITESVFEYVNRVPDIDADASMPVDRYSGLVPTRFVSSFTMPGFKGHLAAYQADPANPTQSRFVWDAGVKLRTPDPSNRFAPGVNITGCGTQNGADPSGTECSFGELHANARADDIKDSSAKIKRRIYTTSGNGVYTFSPQSLMNRTATGRVTLWPPDSGLLPSDYSTCAGTSCWLDQALGLPTSAAPTTYPPDPSCASPTTAAQCWVTWLQTKLKACVGSNLPGGCSSTSVATKLLAARREAREISLALMAGATPVLEGAGLKRLSGGRDRNGILYKNREWVLADSELATPAVMTPPNPVNEPKATPYLAEYKLFRDGTRDGQENTDTTGSQILQGFGLSQPDNDGSAEQGVPDTNVSLKPVMTVVYAPANDGLHAFRAGPCDTPRLDSPNCWDTGGEELWAFVPFDQLHTLLLRAANDPQGRDNHVYSLARGVRFADVFVPGTLTNVDIGGVTVPSLQGVWRRVLYFGRGIGGKYVTALDVTAPGPYTASALSTVAPIPLWSRGNPDTQNGLPNGAYNNIVNGAGDFADYRHMGETWSMPTVAYVQPEVPYATSRRSAVNPCPGTNCIDFVLFMGSGYGNPATYGDPSAREGTTHYVLDALNGDVIKKAEVGERSGEAYPNAIVANSVSFNRSPFDALAKGQFAVGPHPWSFVTTRVYVGDLHGRLWKFLVDDPLGLAIPVADLGQGQPIGTAVALLGEPQIPLDSNSIKPAIFVTTGADRRAQGPFMNVSLLDGGDDRTTTWTGPLTKTTDPPDGATVQYFDPVVARFARFFAEGSPVTECEPGAPKAPFRGTIQPTSAAECVGATDENGKCLGSLVYRVFYGGTRLSLPGTFFAPPTPLACGGTCDPDDPNSICYPCRSQFDSILYAVGVETGQAAYSLDPSGDNAYRVFRDSRITAISFQADPDVAGGGNRLVADEGLIKGVPPKPPPPPGVPPTTETGGSSVTLWRDSGQPAPVVQYGSTVCQ